MVIASLYPIDPMDPEDRGNGMVDDACLVVEHNRRLG